MSHTFALARVEDSDTDTENVLLIRLPTAFFMLMTFFVLVSNFPLV